MMNGVREGVSHRNDPEKNIIYHAFSNGMFWNLYMCMYILLDKYLPLLCYNKYIFASSALEEVFFCNKQRCLYYAQIL